MANLKGKFIEIDYTAKTAKDDNVFDTTKDDVAHENDLEHDHNHAFEPLIICVGEGHILQGLDEHLADKDIGEYTVELSAEDAFGKKNSELIQLIPLKQFKKEGLNPRPGLEIQVDGQYGVVRSKSGGRVVVDFNHPLAGKDLVYDVEILRVVEDKEEQAEALLEVIQMPYDDIKVDGDTVEVHVSMELPDDFKQNLGEEFERLIDATLELKITEDEEQEKE